MKMLIWQRSGIGLLNRLTVPVALALALLVLLLFPSAADALVKEGSDQRGKYTVEDRQTYPIVFIPGMAGTELNLGGDRNLWPGYLLLPDVSFTGEIQGFPHLRLQADGRTPTYGQHAIPTQVMRSGAGSDLGIAGEWYFFPIYQGFYDYMKSEGYTYEPNPKTGKQFFDFAYDFRKDNRLWTQLLDKKVDQALETTKSDRVILVAHSMGGLQARLYMKDPARAKKVAGVVFLATPHHGSPMAFWAFTEGYNFGNAKLSDRTMWLISDNWAGGYQLLPDFNFIQAEDGAFWSLDRTYSKDWVSSQEMLSYNETVRLSGSEKARQAVRYGLPNYDFARDRIAFHRELGDSVDRYPWVKYYMIEGTGVETVQYLEAKMVDVGLAKPKLELKKVKNNRGDGTVPAAGARIQGVEQTFTVKSEHAAIVANKDALMILTGLRKHVNKEDERAKITEAINGYVRPNLNKVRAWKTSGGSGSGSSAAGDGGSKSVFGKGPLRGLLEFIAALIMRGPVDEKKVELRDQVRDLAAKNLEFLRANVVVAAGTEQEDRYYVVINKHQLIDAGPGRITPSNALVQVNSMETFEGILGGRINPNDAIQEGKITLKGTSLVERFKVFLFKWTAKYMR